MEKWQKEYVRKNLSKLTETTRCTAELYATLQEADLLTAPEIEYIETKQVSIAKAYELYSIVQTRTDGYFALIRAMKKLQQTGPLQILCQGFPLDEIKSKRYQFIGTEQALSDFLEEAQIMSIVKELQNNLSIEEYVTVFESINEVESLVNDNIPAPDQFYIERTLRRRMVVDPTIFTIDSTDVFVFDTNDEVDIISLLGDARIQHSADQIRKITVRFIILELPEDWEELKSFSSSPVHLIGFDKESSVFILKDTTGGSELLHQYLNSGDGSFGIQIHEREFFEKIAKSMNCTGVCICDSPGMGKSLLLANLARSATNMYISKIVGFINLPRLAVGLIKRGDQSTEWNGHVLSTLLTTTPLAAAVLEKLFVSQNIAFELFFDSLDEVNEQGRDAVTKYLKQMTRNISNSHIYTTSRNHVRGELEQTLGVLAYDIVPFTLDNQIIYLTSLWNSRLTTICSKKLLKFARTALVAINKKLTEKEKYMTGIPLQCKLIGETLFQDAKIYSHPNRKREIDEHLFDVSLYEIYRGYLKAKIDTNFCDWNCVYKTFPASTLCTQACVVRNYHLIVAIREILPEFVANAISENISCDPVDEETILKCGIVEKRFHGKKVVLKFMHRTFAELLVAAFVENSFYIEPISCKLPTATLKLLYDLLFSWSRVNRDTGDYLYFEYPMIVYFVNAILLENNQFVTFQTNLNMSAMHSLPNGTLIFSNLFWVFLKNHYAGLSMHCLIVLACSRRKKCFREIVLDHLSVIPKFLAQNSTVFTAELIFKSFRELFDIDLNVFCGKKSRNGQTALDLSIHLGNCDALNFFLQKPHRPDNLIYNCVGDTYSISERVLKRRLEMMDILIKKYPAQVTSTDCNPVFAEVVHPKMLKLLLLAGANLQMDDQTIVSHCATYLRKEDFLDVCDFLISELDAYELFLTLENDSLMWIFDEKWGLDAAIEIFRMLENIAVVGVLTNERNLYNEICHILDELLHVPGKTIHSKWNSLIFRLKLRKSDETGVNYLRYIVSKSTNSTNERILNEIHNVSWKTYLANSSSILANNDGENILHFMPGRVDMADIRLVVAFIIENFEALTNTQHRSRLQANSRDSPFSKRQTTDMRKKIPDMFAATTNDGHTPLFYAIRFLQLQPEDLDWYLMGGTSSDYNKDLVVCDINQKNSDGSTLVHEAIDSRQNLDFLKHMYLRGAEFNIIYENDSICEYCLEHFDETSTLSDRLYYLKIVKEILDFGVDVNECDDGNDNYLQCVLLHIERDYMKDNLQGELEKFVNACIKHNVNLQNVNENGETAYDIVQRMFGQVSWLEKLRTDKNNEKSPFQSTASVQNGIVVDLTALSLVKLNRAIFKQIPKFFRNNV